MIILQWNARSLVANGQEFKGFIKEIKENQISYVFKKRGLSHLWIS